MSTGNLKTILSEFDIPQRDYELEQVKYGLINKSYNVIERSSNKKCYFLQQVDHNAFKDIKGIMHNIGIVTNHFKSQPDAPEHLKTQETISGSNYYQSPAGEYWRLYNYIEGHTYYRAENIQIATEAGKMFGNFQNTLDGIDITLLRDTIPGFHDMDMRYEQFLESLSGATIAREEKAAALIVLVKENINYVKSIWHDTVSSCPARVTHNDTKLSNLLFDDNNHGICVVDYDTLMPGFLPLDFGDSVRTICSTTIEDDTNLKDTLFDINIFKALVTSFIAALEESITEPEIKMLPRTAAYMPFIMGLRMLTDYLNNDIYYNVQYDQHNFDRAANQMTLFMSGVELLDEMNNIVQKINY
jgi:hypothetical protein